MPARPGPLDDEQEGGLVARGARDRAEEGRSQADHEPRQARQHLVHLRKVRRLTGRERGGQAPRVARSVDLPLGHDLEWEPASRHPDRGPEVGHDPAPHAIARREDDRAAPERPPAKRLPPATARETSVARGDPIAGSPRGPRITALRPIPTPSSGRRIWETERPDNRVSRRGSRPREWRGPVDARRRPRYRRGAPACRQRASLLHAAEVCMIVEDKLARLGLPLPDLEADYRKNRSGARFVSHRAVGSLLYLSGTVPIRDEEPYLPGLLGAELTIEQGYEAARWALVQALSAVKYALGDLDRFDTAIHLTGYVNSAPGLLEPAARHQRGDRSSRRALRRPGQAHPGGHRVPRPGPQLLGGARPRHQLHRHRRPPAAGPGPLGPVSRARGRPIRGSPRAAARAPRALAFARARAARRAGPRTPRTRQV